MHVIQKQVDRDLTCSILELLVVGWGVSLEAAPYQQKEHGHTICQRHDVLDVELPSDQMEFVLNCVRLNVLHHHFEYRADVFEETFTAMLSLHGLVAAAARVEVDGNVQFGVLLESVGKCIRTFVKITTDPITNILFNIVA